ncbi:TadG family pilus assembly protein [Xenophilus azovorans]|uniref:TadG family pilus assembly protein n=1 Tax=Xenophilus azovorans TaxID=151755 RepID=UPI00056EFDDF|nr:TadG family pilus assembly protein [Xenophilus azovorans]
MNAAAARSPACRAVQRGAVAVLGALWLLLAVTCLMVIDVGYLFWQQREVQRIADLAAMARANGEDFCRAAVPSQLERANGVRDAGDQLAIQCGNWNPALDRGPGSPPQHFAADALPFNAARVTVSREVPYFFAFSWGAGWRTVTATATAAARNTAGFSLGTGLAALNAGAVNQLLGALLNANVALDLASYQGLANAHVRLLDLVALAPSVGTVQELLDTRLGVGQLLALMASALGPDDAVAVTALNRLAALGLDALTVTVGDLLNVTTTNPEAAGTADVNVLELLMVAAQVANGSNLVHLAGGLQLPPLATAATKLVIVEPPSIAIGEAGRDENGQWKTQAHSATVRLLLQASVLDTAAIPVVGNLVDIKALNLPVYLEVAPGDAWLSDIQCAATRTESRALIGASPGLANVCIADVSDAQMRNTSAPVNCGEPATVGKVSALGISLLDVKARVPLSAQVPPGTAATLEFDGVIGNEDDIQRSSSNAVGGVLSSAVGGLGRGLRLQVCTLSFLCLDAGELTKILDRVNTYLLAPLLDVLDSVVQPLLGLLGVQLGYSDIHHQSLSCGEPQLVY